MKWEIRPPLTRKLINQWPLNLAWAMTSGTHIHVQIFVTLRSDKGVLLPYLQVVKG